MTVLVAITELLQAGTSNHDAARELGTDHRRVAAVRAELGLPDARTLKGPARPQDLFRRRTRPAPGGHLEWTGHHNNTGVAVLHTAGRMYTARRVAFRIKWKREPVGRVTVACEYDGCVHPRCIDDKPMREQLDDLYEAIFGRRA
ncbi:MAG TPA: hypothetical protein VGL02_32005 [Streptomyces sp.]